LVQGLGIEIVLLVVALYGFLWKVPFHAHGWEFIFFFGPYYLTAGLPTAVALNWKRTRPDPVRPLAAHDAQPLYVPPRHPVCSITAIYQPQSE
jgi:hypothetical protein